MNPILVGVFAASGDVAMALVAFFIAQKISSWWEKRKKPGEVPRIERWGNSIWRRWGVVGLGFTAPVVAGVVITSALGVVLKIPRGRLLIWMCIGIIFWTSLLVIAGVLGLSWFEKLRP